MINMGTPTFFTSHISLCSNYLLNPKPGEKRTFFTSLRENHPITDSVPFVIDNLNPFSEKLLERNLTTSYMGKYGNRGPYQVPQMKMPSLVGGFVGAKSQSFREESGKLCDILANAFSLICTSNLDNFSKEEFLVDGVVNMKENSIGEELESPKRSLKEESKKCDLSNNELQPTDVLTNNKNNIVLGKNFMNEEPQQNLKSGDQSNFVKRDMPNVKSFTKKLNCDILQKEDKDKPPIKKPKLNLKKCSQSRKRHKSKLKKCKRNVQGETPGYDPNQASFESADEVDCCITLYNRFAPLQNVSGFHMWSESPSDLESTDSPLLDMLNEMHLDDLEVDYDRAPPATDHFNAHSYEGKDSPLTCNSSIAFILSGNDDILVSDSEDGSFASDLEDLQWQSFKADFEFFQEHMPLQDIIVGTCDLTDLHFDTNLEVLDGDIFLNNLEHQTLSDTERRLEEVNSRWNQTFGNQCQRQKPPKVCFAPDSSLTSVFYIPSGPEECQARKGPWDQCYLDRCRFEKRIEELEPIISCCLTPQHRKSVFQRLYGSDEPSH